MSCAIGITVPKQMVLTLKWEYTGAIHFYFFFQKVVSLALIEELRAF